MIPWIIALALLFGASVSTPDRRLGDKQDISMEAMVSQAADEAQLPGRSTSPLLKIPSIPWEYSVLSAQASSLLRVDHTSGHWVRQLVRGVAQGRAPPACPLA